MFNDEIIAYSISKSPNMQIINEMLNNAFDKGRNTKGIIFHSDQGWQYQNHAYRKALQEYGIIQSMPRKGNCLDNAVAEKFFGIMKSEFIIALEEYIDYYNNNRIKNRLNGKSPVQYRAFIQAI